MSMKSEIKRLLREGLISEILFTEANENEPCDCCKYFDFKSLENYTGVQNPLYYMINKNKTEKLMYINPKQYIYRIAQGFGGLSYEDVVDSGVVNKDNITKYMESMKNGDKFPIGFYTEGSSGQEGRHRALALMGLGCEQMPIVVISQYPSDKVHDFVLKHKDTSQEELDLVFKNMGYNGISGLDWREFTKYVEYRL